MSGASKRNWTDEQLDAIMCRCGPVLVSAAAGSGKTAVLVERVIKKLKDGECDIDELLIVTFTNAAAAEMRAKTAAAISALIAEEPRSARLRRQLALVHKADIGTVHSFCLSLIKDNFQLTDLTPDFRVASEAEADMLRRTALDDALELCYAEKDADFLAAADALSAGRNDARFASAVTETARRLSACADPESWMASALASLSGNAKDAGDTDWGAYLLERVSALAEDGIGSLTGALEKMKRYPEVFDAYSEAFSDDIKLGKRLFDAARSKKWDGVYSACSDAAYKRLKSVRGFDDKEFISDMKAKRDGWKKTVALISEKLITCDSKQALADAAAAAPEVRGLFYAACAFEKRYSELKRRRRVVDFNDMERYAMNLLTKRVNGVLTPTELAREISERRREVLVDEYQDTNEVQDAIFSAVSDGGKKLFMVGDVKQSIYRFRMARPEIFLSKYLSFPAYSGDTSREGASGISLTKNFRSRGNVLETVNMIFSRIMTRGFGGVDYVSGEELNEGAVYPEPLNDTYASELYVIDCGSEDGGTQDAEPKAETEARFVAKRLRRLLDSKMPVTDGGVQRPVRPGDIAVLLRSDKGKTPIYEKALKEYGVPCLADAGGGFFESAEIMTVMSFLEAIDNGSRDVPLVSVMRSPVFGFTAEELARIRVNWPDMPFHLAVSREAKSDPNGRCAEVVNMLSSFRAAARDESVSRLVWRIIDETDMTALFSAMENGAARRDNLLAFYTCAIGAAGSLSDGVAGFLRLLYAMRERGNVPERGTSASDGVTVMSIHRSKGLEFPVVVVADCAKRFNEDDTRAPVLFHPDMGVGVKTRDTETNAEYPSAVRSAISERIRIDSLEEELRVLYVALTRAKEKLIITMSMKNAWEKLSEWETYIDKDGMFRREELIRSHSIAPWIAAPLICCSQGGIHPRNADTAHYHLHTELVRAGYSDTDEAMPCDADGLSQTAETETDETELDVSALKYVMEWEYPYAAACGTPSKVTPTQLKGRDIDSEAGEGVSFERKSVNAVRQIRKPSFADDSVLTPAQKGSSHHIAMQYIDFDRCRSREGLESELVRLREKHILSEEQADSVDIDALERFFTSETAERIDRAEKVMREFKFSLLADARDFIPDAPEGESVMLQGVADCVLFEKDGIAVIDFKSDRVYPGGETERAEKYRAQLDAYSYALSRITKQPVKEKILYFFATGAAVRLDNKR